MFGASYNIVRQEGFMQLFRGLTPTLVQVFPQAGFQFAFYTSFTSTWKSMMQKSHSKPTGMFCSNIILTNTL